MNDSTEWRIELADNEWPFNGVDHDRRIVRAIVVDDDGYFYFMRAVRDDDFGVSTLIETSGGGVEPGEDLETAIRRELREELGAEVDVLCKLGVVSDYYNLIHRHNINNYYLCRLRAFGATHMTPEEIGQYHLSTLKLTYDEALREYELRTDSRLGRLIASRELPVLRRAKEVLNLNKGTDTFLNKGTDPGVKIRRAETRDIPALLALLSQVLELHAKIRPDIFVPGTTKYTETALAALLAEEEKPVYVAVDAVDRVLGYAFCVLKHAPAGGFIRPHTALYIDDLCVDEAARGRSLGRMLFQHVTAEARRLGCYEITLNVWEGNDSARRFYESLGMSPKSTQMELIL